MGEHTKLPWRSDRHCFSIYADDVPKGPMRIADMRGWGYLTGKGHGALGLPDDEAMAIQAANAALIVKAVNQYDAHEAVALVALELVTECAGDIPPSLGVLEKLCTALNDLAKAKAASTPDLHGEGG